MTVRIGGKSTPKSRTDSMSSDTSVSSLKLFIGGLSYETTDVSLQNYFGQYGQVDSAVVLRDPTTLRSRGFGFVTFKNAAAASSVVSDVRHLIDGRKVEAKFAVPRATAPASGSSSPTESNGKGSSKKLTVQTTTTSSNNQTSDTVESGNSLSNDSAATTEGSDMPMLRQQNVFGSSASLTGFAAVTAGCPSSPRSGPHPLRKSRSNLDELSAKSDSYTSVNDGFSSYGLLGSLDENVDMHRSYSFDGDLSSSPMKKNTRHNTDPNCRKPRSSSSISASGFNPAKAEKGSSLSSSAGIVSNKIFVGGLLYATGHESLRAFFEQYGPVETAEVIYNRDTKKSRGFGFVVFQHHSSVAKVLEDQEKAMHVVDSKQVEVKRCVARQDSMCSLGGSSNNGQKVTTDGSKSSRSKGKRNQHVEEEKEKEFQSSSPSPSGILASSSSSINVGGNQWAKKPTIITYSRSASASHLTGSGASARSDNMSPMSSEPFGFNDHLQQHRYSPLNHDSYSPMEANRDQRHQMLMHRQHQHQAYQRHQSFSGSLDSDDFYQEDVYIHEDENTLFRNERTGSSSSTSSFFSTSFASPQSSGMIDRSPFQQSFSPRNSDNQAPFGSLPSPSPLSQRGTSLPALPLDHHFNQGMLGSPSPGPVADCTGIWGSSMTLSPKHSEPSMSLEMDEVPMSPAGRHPLEDHRLEIDPLAALRLDDDDNHNLSPSHTVSRSSPLASLGKSFNHSSSSLAPHRQLSNGMHANDQHQFGSDHQKLPDVHALTSPMSKSDSERFPATSMFPTMSFASTTYQPFEG